MVMLDLVLVFVLIIFFVFYCVQKLVNLNKNVFFGLKGWFFIGMFFEFDLLIFYLKFNNWIVKYGEIFQFELFGKKFVSLNLFEVFREVFN